jgi:hypothetical protein
VGRGLGVSAVVAYKLQEEVGLLFIQTVGIVGHGYVHGTILVEEVYLVEVDVDAPEAGEEGAGSSAVRFGRGFS